MARHYKKEIARLKRLLRARNKEIADLQTQVRGLQRQVTHAAKATGEMGAHARAAEVALAAARLDARGIHVFGGRGSRLGGAMEIPPLTQATRKLIDSQPQPALK